MKPSLQVRLSQHLALTPQLQQSIRLLQLSTLELHQEVEQMLEQNPFLEDRGGAGSPFETPLDRAREGRPRRSERERDRARGDEAAAADAAERRRPSCRVSAEFGTTERDDWENGTEATTSTASARCRRAAAARRPATTTTARRRTARHRPSAADHLRAQIAGMRLSPDDLAALLVLIDSLDGDGYLADPLEEIAERLAEMLDQRRRGRARSCSTGCAARCAGCRAWSRRRGRARRWSECLCCSCAPARQPARPVAIASASGTSTCWRGAT
jgi:RNA polymerase sigma-54 factor